MRKRLSVLWKAIAAGACIALGGLFFLLAKAYVPGDWGKLLGALLFPLGLLAICYARFNLYTGKIGIAPNQGVDTSGLNVFEWLAWILIGNVIGAFAVGLAVSPLALAGGSFADAIAAAGASREAMPAVEMLALSVLCGVLVYVAVYLFGKAESHFWRAVGVAVPIAFFVYSGMQHCVANMFYMAASWRWTAASWANLALCVLGNSCGGLLANFAHCLTLKQSD